MVQEVKKKLPGFTIMELVMVMILSTIVIAIGYEVWSISEQQFHSMSEVTDIQTELSECYSVIKTDFRMSDVVIVKNGNLLMFNEIGNVAYQFYEEEIIRIFEENDAFHESKFLIKTAGLDFLYENNLVFDGIVDFVEIQLDNQSDREITPWQFSKEYDVKTKLNF